MPRLKIQRKFIIITFIIKFRSSHLHEVLPLGLTLDLAVTFSYRDPTIENHICKNFTYYKFKCKKTINVKKKN